MFDSGRYNPVPSEMLMSDLVLLWSGKDSWARCSSLVLTALFDSLNMMKMRMLDLMTWGRLGDVYGVPNGC